MIRKCKLAFLFLALFSLLIVSGCATSNPYIGFGSYKGDPPRGNVGLGVGIGFE
ncbi:MAG: sporulation protein YjcZ [Deltaproteobacteria bacterium]